MEPALSELVRSCIGQTGPNYSCVALSSDSIFIIIIIIIIHNHDDIYSAVIYGASHMREFTVVSLGESRSAPGGRQLVGQTANLTFESACRLL